MSRALCESPIAATVRTGLFFSLCAALGPCVQAQHMDGATGAEWPHYGGTQSAWRYSALDQINRGNVHELAPAWIFQTGEDADAFQATPIVVDGILYVSTNHGQVFAVDAATGDPIWHYRYPPPDPNAASFILTRPQNRGVAVSEGRVFLGTYDNHVVAIDASTGLELWKVNVDNTRQCGCLISGAPLIAEDKVIVGGTGGDGAHRGYLTAFDTATGRLAWRFYIVPGPGEPGNETWKGDSWKHGGGAAWMTGSFDPELRLVYWGTGNAASDFYSGDRVREGADLDGPVNLYTASVVALEVDTGELRWYYQEIPNDVWDYDSAYEVVLFDRMVDGESRKLLLHMNKSGLTFVLDRVTGELINVFSVAEEQTWISGFTEDGRLLGRREPREGESINVCPSGLVGAKSWNQMAYSPRTGLIYTPTIEICMDVTARQQEPIEGRFFAGGSASVNLPPGREMISHLDAYDPLTGERKWTLPYRYVLVSSILATAGDLVFTGDPEGFFFALDADTGEELWRFQTGAGLRSSSVTYQIEGRQFVAVPSGWGSVIGPMTASLFPGEGEKWRHGSALVVFALPEASH
ncbi:MAG: PQQ-dependent dehydrogenase, methanol/ethanol family [Rhodospirillaceae bacterium]|nr:PQQ-dependent dehydrogenase, methanol/ethanol family [Rhodospirillaceae bacterium]